MKKYKALFLQIFKFGLVGGSAFIIDYGIMILLTDVLHINYLVSTTMSFSVSVIYNYILSTKWVFDDTKKHSGAEKFVVFLILSIIGLGINELLMYLSVDKLAIDHKLAKIGVTAIVMVYNFITRKLFLESRSPDTEKKA